MTSTTKKEDDSVVEYLVSIGFKRMSEEEEQELLKELGAGRWSFNLKLDKSKCSNKRPIC